MLSPLNRFYLGSFLSYTYFWIAIAIPYLTYRGFPLSTALFMLSGYNIACSILEVPTGVFGDLHGYRKSHLIGTLCMIFSHILFIIYPHMILYLVALFFVALGISFHSGNDFGLINGLSSNQKKAIADMKFYADMALFFSAITGGLLMSIHPILPFIINILVWIVAFVVMRTVPETRIIQKTGNILVTAKQGIGAVKHSPTLIGLVILFTILFGFGAGIKLWFGSFGDIFNLSPAVVGYLIGGGILLRAIGSKLNGVFEIPISLHIIVMTASLLLASVAPSNFLIITLILVFQFTIGGLLTRIDHQFQLHSPDHVRASVFSFRRLSSRMFQSIYFFVLGAFFSKQNLSLIFVSVSALIIFSYLIYNYFTRKSYAQTR